MRFKKQQHAVKDTIVSSSLHQTFSRALYTLSTLRCTSSHDVKTLMTGGVSRNEKLYMVGHMYTY